MLFVEFAYLTHPGLLRRHNQDNLICLKEYLPEAHDRTAEPVTGSTANSPCALFGVFDGMGGEEHGEAASYIAAKAAASGSISDMTGLEAFCRKANGEICEYVKKKGFRSSGTTASMLLFDHQGVSICHIGDSRIYRCDNGKLVQLTKDDVWPSFSRGKKPLLQCLGIPEDEMRIRPHLDYHPIRSETVFMICTDGLSDMITEDEIAMIVSNGRDLKWQAQMLLDQTLKVGGKDNITLFLIRVVPC